MVSQANKIVDADMIEPGQSNEDLRRDHAFSAFVISVSSLRYIDPLSKFCLRQVSIFS